MKWLVLFAATGICLAQQPSVEQAWRLVGKGQRDQAIQLLNKVIETNPTNADARLLLGSLQMEAGAKSEAIAQLSEAVRLRPQSAEAQNALGEAYHNFDEKQLAEQAFQKAVSLDPKFGQAQVNLGLVLLEEGKLDPAVPHLDEAVKILGHTPEAAYPHYLLAKVSSARHQSGDAVKELNTAVSLRPDFAEAWSDLGQARKENLDEDGALRAFEQAVKLNPADSVAQYRLGAEYLHRQKPHEAVEHLEQSYRLNSQDQSTLNALQSALRQDGKVEEANRIKAELAELLRRKDETVQREVRAVELNNEGAGLEKSGDLRGAAEKYREALLFNPEHVGIRVNYAIALLRLGVWTEGLNELHEALRRDPQNTKIRAALKDALAQAPPGSAPNWNDEWSRAGRQQDK
jgi:tetratricopeptide (TPR) repeat protein